MAKVQKKSCHCNDCYELGKIKEAIGLISYSWICKGSGDPDPFTALEKFKKVLKRYRYCMDECPFRSLDNNGYRIKNQGQFNKKVK